MNGILPGAKIETLGQWSSFSDLRRMISVADGLTLAQVCAITGLLPSTIQNWVKRGFVARPVKKKYYERQLARILLISALRDCMLIDNIGYLLCFINGDTEDESDDIVTEQALYGYFTESVKLIGSKLSDLNEIKGAVRRATRGYQAQAEGCEERLREALAVMVYAYAAGQLKKQSENLLEKLKENDNERH